ncbi:transposase [Enterococcus faecium]|uniref:transposase n=1 Tax=Enterococcus faecium TaxID=1352 RepID=UPI003977C1C0
MVIPPAIFFYYSTLFDSRFKTLQQNLPNQTSANRLIGAVLMDLHDEWIYSSRKYINFDK